MKIKLVARDVEIDISGEKVKVDIYVNEKGNLEIQGIGSVTYEIYDEELELVRI